MTDTKRVSREPTPEQIMAWHNERRYGPQDGTPAAEPDVERRIRELAEGTCGALVCHAFIEDALRTFGAEQRAAEREACAKVADEYPKKAAARMEMMPTEEMRTTGIGIAAVIRSRHD